MRPSRRRLAAVLVACAVCAALWMHMPAMPRPGPAAPLPRGAVKPLPDEPAPIKVVPADAAATTRAAAPDTVAPWRRPHDAAEARRANAEQRIFNADKFPWDAAHAEASVIVVMVHDRPPYLHALLATLAEARSIAHALVVFSMDVVSPDIEAELDAIDFCAYMRLYLPHAVAFHPTSFPGNDPNDCPRDATRAAAEAMGCNNAKHPDKYGHYRESKFCAIKHHWWWKLVFTFEEVRAVEAYAGMVLLLEEDYAVTPDALPVMRLAAAVAAEQCPDCVFLTLGQYTPGADAALVRIGPWQSVKHNMGMALNRRAWTRIKACAEEFCTYDDYNWDWTLAKLGASCLAPLEAVVADVGRVRHLGKCGVHSVADNCDISAALQEFRAQTALLATPPARLTAGRLAGRQHLGSANGGWGDVRDHALCRNITGVPLGK